LRALVAVPFAALRAVLAVRLAPDFARRAEPDADEERDDADDERDDPDEERELPDRGLRPEVERPERLEREPPERLEREPPDEDDDFGWGIPVPSSWPGLGVEAIRKVLPDLPAPYTRSGRTPSSVCGDKQL
jgi:hypothetical protein